jgi:hypothetical protein
LDGETKDPNYPGRLDWEEEASTRIANALEMIAVIRKAQKDFAKTDENGTKRQKVKHNSERNIKHNLDGETKDPNYPGRLDWEEEASTRIANALEMIAVIRKAQKDFATTAANGNKHQKMKHTSDKVKHTYEREIKTNGPTYPGRLDWGEKASAGVASTIALLGTAARDLAQQDEANAIVVDDDNAIEFAAVEVDVLDFDYPDADLADQDEEGEDKTPDDDNAIEFAAVEVDVVDFDSPDTALADQDEEVQLQAPITSTVMMAAPLLRRSKRVVDQRKQALRSGVIPKNPYAFGNLRRSARIAALPRVNYSKY